VNVSRGDFLKLCATALVGLSADLPSSLGGGVLHAAAARDVTPVDHGARFEWARASASLFEPHVDSIFDAHDENGGVERLRLSRVVRRPAPGLEQFSLLFDGTAGRAVHGIVTLRHATLGEFAVYVAPVGAAGDRGTCEACFSRYLGRA